MRLLKCNFLKISFIFIASLLSFYSHADTVTYYHNDISGSPLVATDSGGNLLWKENYRPYGDKINIEAAGTDNKIGFHGRPFDNVSGLSYMGARYYDPLLGRFIGIDPQTVNPDDVHGFNRYSYGNNNPYRFVDPDGHSPIDVAFLAWDIGKLGLAMYTGVGVGGAVADVAMSVVGVMSPIPGTGQAMKIARAAEHAVEATKVVKSAGKIGREGEAAVRAHYKIGASPKKLIDMNGRKRRPDGLNNVELSEVKNTSRQAWTQQLRDYSAYAKENNLNFVLYVRPSTKLTPPLEKALREGHVEIKYIIPLHSAK
ncbi:putative toxin [Janthinobacterium sp. SUN118]|uniref:RHS repeat-associated core domain-containing protein n=1 Tax=Janthinobacterium sp. SUN118 TaxID=3004100 RepID=UPI0025AF52B9|nr:RHS repeat-associated core domain-containing protein [Janthinobacterium sp. SUN118]MDN2708807.1 putative toxin [Janthinobacterium sp. SUN118]